MADACMHTFGKPRVADCISIAFELWIWCSLVFNGFIYQNSFYQSGLQRCYRVVSFVPFDPPGDRIVKVNGESIIGKTYSQVIALIQNR